MNRSTAAEIPTLRVVRERGTSLPAPLTSFIGREKVLTDVVASIGSHRLLTLTGPGGSGKTRLSIEAARSVATSFDDGVTWVELAPITDPEMVAQRLATALGIRHQPGRAPADAISEYLAARNALLVLDNCEHVIEAVAELLASVLHEAPRVHVLATSRERISLPGERALPIPPLGLPPRNARELDTLLESESVRLFIDRASAVLPAFAIDTATAGAIAEICVRVDGIPLAIELAAARMNVLAPRQIADRLADAMTLLTTGARTLPKRQRTLRAAIDWSYRLLSPFERRLFRSLSVFAGSFTLDAAESVCADDELSQSEVLDLLASLADKSLVLVIEREGEARYRMLDTVDQFATELLEEEGRADEVRLRHAQHYERIVELHAPHLRSAQRSRVLPILDAEHDNIRAALDWTRDTPGFVSMHQRLASRVWWYWLHRIFWDEGLHRLSHAVAMDDGADPAVLSEALYGAGFLAWVSGIFLQARTWLERAVELRRDGAAGPLGMAMCALAQTVCDLGEREDALRMVREGLVLARQDCTPWELAIVLTSAYGYVHHATGERDEAERAYREADELFGDDDWGRSLTRNSLAVLAWRRGDLVRAAGHARDSLELLRSVRDRWFASRALQVLGYITAQQGDSARAIAMLAASDALRGEAGARLMPFEVPEWTRTIDHARRELGDVAFNAAWSAGSHADFDTAIELGLHQSARNQAAPAPRDADAFDRILAPVEAAPVPAGEVPVSGVDSFRDDCELVVRALGSLEVRREGRTLTNEDWTYARPRELLFYLLCHRRGRTKEQIGLDLWPEATPAQLRSSFHVTMHHLRRALGDPCWVAFDDGRYRFDVVRTFAFDVDHFERCWDEAHELRARTDPDDVARRVRLLQSAIDCYRGDFLDDAGFGDWTLVHRDRLRRRFADAAIDLAGAYLAQQRFDHAAAVCRSLLATDNLDERAHRLLIMTLADAGRPADALRHHAVLTTLFREELGISPSAETQALVARISRS